MMPFVLDFRGVEPSALAEQAVRRCIAALAPLEGFVVGAQVEVGRARDARYDVCVELALPLGHIVSTCRASDVEAATAGALEKLLPRVTKSFEPWMKQRALA